MSCFEGEEVDKSFNARQFTTIPERRQSKDDFRRGYCSVFEGLDREQVRRWERVEGSSGKRKCVCVGSAYS
jgi:hypothetical protein